MARNFYNLPPPWNPGYAIPKSVMDEGLQRHAYVTRMLPRGTYDNSTDGSAGYAIPQYVLAEGTGRGTFTTKWAPRGTRPNVPHYLDRHPLPPVFRRGRRSLGDSNGGGGDGGSNNAFVIYGQRAASEILSSLRGVNPSQREQVLHQVMASIDPGLPGRTQAETRRAVAQGVPPQQALQVGLAKAMTAGMLEELVRVGRSRSVPQPRSLLGLGIYGPEAIGATTPEPGLPAPVPAGNMIQVGPFTFPVGNKPFVLVEGAKALDALPGGMNRFIRRALTISPREAELLAPSLRIAGDLEKKLQLQKAPTSKFWQDVLGIRTTETVTMRAISPKMTEGKWSDDDDGRAMPIATFDHPVSGNKWGIFFALFGPKERPYSGQLYVKWLPEKPWYAKALNWIGSIPAKIVKLVEKLAKLGCQVLQSPGGAQGAAMASAHPAAAVGVTVAAALCGPGQQPVAPPVDTGPSLVTVLAIGGGALLALHLITKKKTS